MQGSGVSYKSDGQEGSCRGYGTSPTDMKGRAGRYRTRRDRGSRGSWNSTWGPEWEPVPVALNLLGSPDTRGLSSTRSESLPGVRRGQKTSTETLLG